MNHEYLRHTEPNSETGKDDVYTMLPSDLDDWERTSLIDAGAIAVEISNMYEDEISGKILKEIVSDGRFDWMLGELDKKGRWQVVDEAEPNKTGIQAWYESQLARTSNPTESADRRRRIKELKDQLVQLKEVIDADPSRSSPWAK